MAPAAADPGAPHAGPGGAPPRAEERGEVPADPARRIRTDGVPPELRECLRRFDRLDPGFAWSLGPGRTSGWGYQIQKVTFPSAAPGAHDANNTVYGDYYRPDREGRAPAVAVLDILDGRGVVARLVCDHLAKRGVASLTIRMAYYGERRGPPEAREAMLDSPEKLVEAMAQNVADVGRAALWLRRRPEVDPERVGLCGVSFGGIVGATAAGVYADFPRTALVLSGGDVGEIFWSGSETAKVRRRLEAQGVTREALDRAVAAVDPLTYAARVARGSVFMVNAEKDEAVPPACTRKLWEALGRPPIRWYNAGHYTLGWRTFEVLDRVGDLFEEERWGAIPNPESR